MNDIPCDNLNLGRPQKKFTLTKCGTIYDYSFKVFCPNLGLELATRHCSLVSDSWETVRAPIGAGQFQTVGRLSGHPSVQVSFRQLGRLSGHPLVQVSFRQLGDCQGTRRCRPVSDSWEAVRAPIGAGQFQTVGRLSGHPSMQASFRQLRDCQGTRRCRSVLRLVHTMRLRHHHRNYRQNGYATYSACNNACHNVHQKDQTCRLSTLRLR